MRTHAHVQGFRFDLRRLSAPWLFAVVVIGAPWLVAGCQGANEPEPHAQAEIDPRNTSYTIESTRVTLVDGAAEEPPAPGSSSRVVTRVWDEPTLGDLNGDGSNDAVLILIRTTGGSGTFYYVAAAIASADRYSGTTGLLLGDRIDPKSIDVRDGRASVRFMTRRADESFADRPTIEKTRDFLYTAESHQLVEVAHDFEGEADPSRMTLEMKPWTWIKTVYNNDTVEEPTQRDAFTLTFRDGRVAGTTDCNNFSGAYTTDDRKIQFDDKMASTRKFCADSQETEFLKMLQSVNSYLFTSQGQLILEIKYDSGTMQFR